MRKSIWIIVHESLTGTEVRTFVARDFDPSFLSLPEDQEALAKLCGLDFYRDDGTSLRVYPFGGNIPVLSLAGVRTVSRRLMKRKKRPGGVCAETIG